MDQIFVSKQNYKRFDPQMFHAKLNRPGGESGLFQVCTETSETRLQ
jgi:hypothetical protein